MTGSRDGMQLMGAAALMINRIVVFLILCCFLGSFFIEKEIFRLASFGCKSMVRVQKEWQVHIAVTHYRH